ncbi:SDR family oxidoreductase [Francisella sp. 19X1-34]|uniref:SDR family NAD(P)-dependent oxidoreductase n=1 Tax=Francisella sp. 19X1-34 TaxID=3087177 RepID=UPI002E33204F|nr:SDR family oxidoreductase [Francisella sp. 19X1-34]MED7787675.1 SDR family oxidoreductase [Francisella sp. 19X1-34]
MNISNKTVLITGGASGIGLGIVNFCISNGVDQIILLDSDELAISELVKKYPEKKIICFKVDISNERKVDDIFKHLKDRVQDIDFLINCAGVSGPFGPIWETPVEQFKWTLDVNFYGTYYVLRSFLLYYKNNKNIMHIVNVSSHLGLLTESHLSAYQSSKHAITALTEAVLMDLKDNNIDNINLHLYVPFFIKSNLCNSGRHLKNHDLYISEKSYNFYKQIGDLTEQGLEAIKAAENLFESIAKNEGYIFTDNQTKEDFHARALNITNGHNLYSRNIR